MTQYYRRFGLVSLLLALLTAALALWEPSVRAEVASSAPQGDAVAVTASIRVALSDQVDRTVTARSFRIAPMVPGEISWQQNTLVFTPSRPLTPTLDYRVTISPASSRSIGAAPVSWSFRTRAPRLFFLGENTATSAGLWVVDDTPARRVIDAPAITGYTLAPDGERVAYSVRRADGREALLIFNLRDNTTKTISDAADEQASQPAWSPANDFIAYTRSMRSSGAWQPGAIWLAQTDGTPLGPLALGVAGESPQFAGGAQRLAFLNGSALSVVSLGGAGGKVADGAHSPLAWSPDGSHIAFATVQSQVQVVEVATREAKTIAADTTAFGWLLDGRLVTASGGALRIGDAAPRPLCTTPITALALATDSTTLAASCYTEGQRPKIVTATLGEFTPTVVGYGTQPQWGP